MQMPAWNKLARYSPIAHLGPIRDEAVLNGVEVLYQVSENSWWAGSYPVDAMLWVESLVKQGDRTATILIDSPGGSVYSMLGIVDAIRWYQGMGCVLRTVVRGMAMSAAAIIASCGTKGERLAGRNSTFLIHEPSSWSQGSATDIRIQHEELERLTQVVAYILSVNTGRKAEDIKKLMQDKRNWYLSPHDAVDFGLVDAVI